MLTDSGTGAYLRADCESDEPARPGGSGQCPDSEADRGPTGARRGGCSSGRSASTPPTAPGALSEPRHERDGHQDGGSLWDGRGNGSGGLASTLPSSTPSRRSSEPPLRLRRPALHRRRQRGELPRPPPACHQRRHGLLRVGRGVGEQLPARPPVAGKQKRAEVWRAVDRSVVLLRRDDSGVVPELQGGKRRQGLTAGNAQQALRGCKSRAK